LTYSGGEPISPGDPVGVGLVVLAAVGVGILGPLSRFAADAGVDSITLVTWRAGLGATCMGSYLLARHATSGHASVSLRQLRVSERWFLAAAPLANAILNVSVFVAFQRISIALAVLVFYLHPAFVAIASVVWFGDTFDRVDWGALAVSLVGIALIVGGAGAIGHLDPLGLGLAVVAALGQTFYILAARHGFVHVPGAQAAAVTMGGATLLYLLVASLTGALEPLGQPLASGEAFMVVIVAGVFGAGIPTVCYILGIRRLGAPRAAILSTLGPILAVALAALLFREMPTALQVVGGALVITASVLLQFRRRRDMAEHDAVA
jgi:drug/metabolite transporter (DMT)-like permease